MHSTQESPGTQNFSNSGSEMPGVIPGIGVRFNHVDPAALGAIRDFMRQRRPVFFDA